jgi:DNA ligase-1
MKVNFKMEGLPKEYIYDGEVMRNDGTEFNGTSGLINSKYGDKSSLVYNIFDIMYDNVTYDDRRDLLNVIESSNKNTVRDWRIIPVLACWDFDQFVERGPGLLDDITSAGGEGLMVNVGNALYQHKRTNDLLKFKKVQTMDMYVVGIIEGTGKYEGMVGSLDCYAKFDDGTCVMCQVGSGLSDDQRWAWSVNPNAIVGKIIEVAYFSKSQNKSTDGSYYYSLRFPRLKQVRTDKTEVSKY